MCRELRIRGLWHTFKTRTCFLNLLRRPLIFTSPWQSSYSRVPREIWCLHVPVHVACVGF